MTPTLILGGTTEASQLAALLARAGLPAILSYAGRVQQPRAQPVAVRVGGFGGPQGLARYVATHRIGRIVDATHPFAARISHNAALAARETGVPLCALQRPAWAPGPGDRWESHPDIAAAVAALDHAPARVFLAIGRLHLAEFAGLTQHDFLTRIVDPPGADFPLPKAQVVVARGPFDLGGELALLRAHGTEVLLTKNAGGSGTEAKLAAARALGLRIMMIERPAAPARLVLPRPEQVMDWLHARLGV